MRANFISSDINISNAETQDLTNLGNFTLEQLPVGTLDVDRMVQRGSMDMRKVERFKRNWNEDAVGTITVSKRGPVTFIVLDGQHRVQAKRELTNNQGVILARVFENLTIEEEAQMFLDLNAGTQPSLLDKFRVQVVAGDRAAIAINQMAHAYGWDVVGNSTTGSVSCVGALQRIYKRSVAAEAEPNLVQAAFLVITRAWGNDRDGAAAVILEGISALVLEYGSLVELDRLVSKLKAYPGGPAGLHDNARDLARSRRMSVTMAVAETMANEYNKGLRKEEKVLHPWTRRRF